MAYVAPPPSGLVHDAAPQIGLRPGPRRPTLIALPPAAPIAFDSLADLARHIQVERAERGLELHAGVASYDGCDSFPCFRVTWLGPDGDPQYAFTVAVQKTSRDALMAAIAAANPKLPKALRRAAA